MIDLIAKVDPTIVIASGFDDCLIGLTFRGDKLVALYSADSAIAKLSQDMSYDDAVQYFLFNIEGAYMGEKTPVFFWGGHDASLGD